MGNGDSRQRTAGQLSQMNYPMKRLLQMPIVAVSLLLLARAAIAETGQKVMFGLDFLGLPKYPAVAAKEFPKGWALGAFAKEFGDALPTIQKIVATGKTPLVRVQLLWGGSGHSYSDNDIPAIIKEAQRYQKLAVKYPKVRFELSPFCEHNVPNPDFYLKIVATSAPACFPVNTPMHGAYSKKYKNETHDTDKALTGSYNFSFDGAMCVDADVTKAKETHGNAEVFFFWTSQFNLRLNTNDLTPLPARKAVPTAGLIQSVVYLSKDKGTTGLPEHYLWKSHADQHNAPVPEARALKPVLIAPVKADKFELVATNGKVVGTLSYYGPFAEDNPAVPRYRYYLNEFGYQVAQKASKLQGSPVLNLRPVSNKVAGGVVGKLNPAFREGKFR